MTTYLIVFGWIHPKEGGDDYQFERGFHIENYKARKREFKKFIEKDLRKKSAVLDYKIRQVTESEWLKRYTKTQ